MEGWIKLHRQLVDWEWYSDSVVKDVFIHLLLFANHSDINFRGESLKQGSVVTSVKSLSSALGFTDSQIRRALKKLESTGEITVKTTNKFSLINIGKYSAFQSLSSESEQTNNKQRANKEQSKSKQTTTYNNEKNEKNEKNIHIEKNEEEIALRYDNLERLKEVYPDISWDAYDEHDFELRPVCFEQGRGVVYLSMIQEDFLIDEIQNACIFLNYIGRLADFIIDNNARVKNHYLTILKWWKEDGRLS